jgi:hypothetical protein
LEGRLAVCEIALHSVLQLDQDLLAVAEGLESMGPVVLRQETLLVRVNLSEQLLQQRLGHVETIQAVQLLNEFLKLFKGKLGQSLRCIIV